LLYSWNIVKKIKHINTYTVANSWSIIIGHTTVANSWSIIIGHTTIKPNYTVSLFKLKKEKYVLKKVPCCDPAVGIMDAAGRQTNDDFFYSKACNILLT